MQDTVAISIVIPAYNEEKLIGRCLTSLKKQRFNKPYEIIVVDNNSTDQTVKVARYFRVKTITATCNIVAARQIGLLNAKGEIIVGADCDCEYPLDYLMQIYELFEKRPEIVAVAGPVIPELHPYWGYLHLKLGFLLVKHVYSLFGKTLYVVAGNFAYRKRVFLTLGGYRTYFDFGGDEIDPLWRLNRLGHVLYKHDLLIRTSSRRYKVGFGKWLTVHLFTYYILNYIFASLFKRPLVAAKPVRNI